METGPASAAKRLLPLYEERLEPWMSAASAQSSCKRGCSGCCHNLVGSTLAEGVLIAERVLGDRELLRDLPVIRAALERQIRAIQGLAGESPDEYLERGGPCALLDQRTGECRVYDVRPTACRLHYVRSDPSMCGRPGATTVRIQANALTMGFEDAVRDATSGDIPPVTGALQAMLLLGIEMLSRPREEFDAILGTEWESL